MNNKVKNLKSLIKRNSQYIGTYFDTGWMWGRRSLSIVADSDLKDILENDEIAIAILYDTLTKFDCVYEEKLNLKEFVSLYKFLKKNFEVDIFYDGDDLVLSLGVKENMNNE